MIEISNYNNANIRIKKLINKILNNGYINDSCGYKIDFLNCLIIINEEKVKNSIGFSKTNTQNLINLPVLKTINFNKSKISMI